MPKIALSVSWPQPPTDEKDVERLRKYVAMVEREGSTLLPLYLDVWEGRGREAATEFDGLILAGGADLPTSWYNEEPLPGAGLDLVSERRPLLERALVQGFLEAGKPILGICYGCQFLNVHQGGTLLQDIDLQWEEPLEHRDGVVHSVATLEGSRLKEIVGVAEFDVPSFHHQAVGRVAPGATAVAWAPDGIVEALEWPGEKFVLGVQWHPERAPDSEATRSITRRFLLASQS